ncbi:MAG: redox-sensing transcriptional repressor Rex [bacterium]|nr:redox-sensing transcriptional repressor Rex [bacterium]
MALETRLSDATIRRLSMYLRTLESAHQQRIRTVSSQYIAAENKITAAQVRKDLSYFGAFGRRGLGYNVLTLMTSISKLLGLNRTWNVALIGVGNIGRALVAYEGFRNRGFNIKLLIDNDPDKIGTKVNGLTIQSPKDAELFYKEFEIAITIISVPAHSAQAAADLAVQAGCRAILNFAPVTLQVPQNVFVRQENMAYEIESLSFFLTNKKM